MSMDLSGREARAWSVHRRDGLTLGFTDHDAVLRFGGMTYRPQAGMGAGVLTKGAGLSVDNSEAIGILSDDAITEADLRAGRWDGAEIRLWQVDWGDPDQRRMLFRGSLGEVVLSGAGFRAELRGLTEPLNQPRERVYHPRCSAVLGDAACGVDLTRPGFRAEGSLHEILRPGVWILDAVEAHETGWFALGVVQLLSGAGEGLKGVIRDDFPLPDGKRRIDLMQVPGIVPEVGDRLQLTAGCNKSGEVCRVKFGNYLNFRGFPHLPPEDWLLAPQNRRPGGSA